eukprot:1763964-Rhodomonas_salina.2
MHNDAAPYGLYQERSDSELIWEPPPEVAAGCPRGTGRSRAPEPPLPAPRVTQRAQSRDGASAFYETKRTQSVDWTCNRQQTPTSAVVGQGLAMAVASRFGPQQYRSPPYYAYNTKMYEEKKHACKCCSGLQVPPA